MNMPQQFLLVGKKAIQCLSVCDRNRTKMIRQLRYTMYNIIPW